jgi:hypothetical protein
MSGTDVATLALGAPSIRVMLGTTAQKMPGGDEFKPVKLPAALVENDGVHSFRNVAIIRVVGKGASPADIAKRIDQALRKAIAFSIGGALLASVAVGVVLWTLSARHTVPAPVVGSPCLVASLQAGSVTCRIGNDTTSVLPGSFFPDGSFRLEKVLPEQSEFIAVHVPTGRTIAFQLSSSPR